MSNNKKVGNIPTAHIFYWVCTDCDHKNYRKGDLRGQKVLFDYCHECKCGAPIMSPFKEDRIIK